MDLEAALPRLRAETPACAEVVHFNHAGDSPSPRPVLDVIEAHLEREARIGGYEAEEEVADRVRAIYASIGRLINAGTDEIAIVENATRAWDMAFYSIPLGPGDRILTSRSEYGSNTIAFLQAAARTGASVEVVPNDEHGQVSVDALAEMLDERVKVVAVSHMPTNGGLVQPAAEIGRLTREAGAFYLLDACQTVGQMPIDVAELGADALAATSRKYLRGPRGVGFLYVRRDRIADLTPPLLDIHAATWVAPDRYEIQPDARRFENWESPIAAKLGMGRAVDYALDIGLDTIWDRIQPLAARLREELAAIPIVRALDLGRVKGGIVTFTLDGVAAADVVAALRAQRINTSVSPVTSTRYDMEARRLDDIVRASVHYLTTDDEIRVLVDAVAAIASGTRPAS
ncbi:MAG TPA: aminotransferase class V-fold PLP-dependent enzyme [Candidatus Limnocylindria bacterium]|nr:aminotransferase class V-fold PLP-dependent enzyme [Candidatus Limnocylindria bacterium]